VGGRTSRSLSFPCRVPLLFVLYGGVSYRYRHNDRTICPPFLITSDQFGGFMWVFEKSRLEVCFTCQVMESLLKKCIYPLPSSATVPGAFTPVGKGHRCNCLCNCCCMYYVLSRREMDTLQVTAIALSSVVSRFILYDQDQHHSHVLYGRVYFCTCVSWITHKPLIPADRFHGLFVCGRLF